jgi:hypothetical protein
VTAKTKLKLRDTTRYNKDTKLRSKGVKKACELIYTAVTKTEEKARQRSCIDEDSKLRKRRRREPLTLD